MTDTTLAAQTVETSSLVYPDHSVRSGMMDAIALCASIERDIEAIRHPSKERDAICAAIKRCVDAIEEMRKMVTMP